MSFTRSCKNLAGVANFLSDPLRPIEATLNAMLATPHLGDRVIGGGLGGARAAQQERE